MYLIIPITLHTFPNTTYFTISTVHFTIPSNNPFFTIIIQLCTFPITTHFVIPITVTEYRNWPRYGLHWSDLCCHSRHSTSGAGRRAAPHCTFYYPIQLSIFTIITELFIFLITEHLVIRITVTEQYLYPLKCILPSSSLHILFPQLLHISLSLYILLPPSLNINTSPPSTTYMHQWTESALVQVMACRLFGTKPLPKTNAGLLSIGLLGINFSEIQIEILSFSFKKMYLKLSSANMAAVLSRRRWVNNPVWYQLIIRTTADLLLFRPLGTQKIRKLLPRNCVHTVLLSLQ